jgi:hypothetical protein
VNGVIMTAAFPRFAFLQIRHWRISVPLYLAGNLATRPLTQFDNGGEGLV